ncbi:MAG TPA: condensation domain-containing protein, partial [Ktedonobacteraceae bacterium]|nr:condensation domain-containing protein [Ktedonobacteraceae bacterium]
MSDLDQRIARLSPEKREILLKRLNKQQNTSSSQAPIARRSTTSQVVPLSFAQESLWLVDQIAPGNAAYNLSCAMRLVGPLNVDALEQALQEIVKRHESVRTTFLVHQGQPTQVIAPSLTIPLEIVDFHQLPEAEREQRVREHLTAEAARPFNLSQGPLLRMTLLRLAENQHILLLVMHHIISDEWSIEVLTREVTTLYGAFSAGQPSPLLDLPIQYADYTLWQRERLQGESMNQLLDYWKRRLEGTPEVLELPADHPRPPVQTFQGASLPFQLSTVLNDHLRALSRQEQTSLFMTLLAAFNVLLARYTHNEDIVVGSPITNRSRAETEGLIGYLVNMLVLRADLSGNLSFRELLRQVRKTTLEAYTLQDLPFEKLVEAMQPKRSLSYTPLFQIIFQLENAPPSQLEVGGVNWQWLEIDRFTAKFDLQLSIRENQNELSGLFTYNTDLFEAATIQRMVGHLQTLLEGIVADPDQPITSLPLLTETERQQLLVQKNADQAKYVQSQSIHQIFEAQVDRTPDAIALIYDDTQLTYRQLNERANQLAHYLRQLGVGPEVLVGLCVERSVEMIVGLLGILKAGGAYVPLDPSYPKERLAIMLADAQVPVLLTQTTLQASLPAYAGKVICLDVDSQTITQAGTENLDSGTQPEHLAYVIYTSGSTGTPKGVMVTHSNVTRLFAATDAWYHFNERDVWTFFHSYAFDFSV